MNEPQTDVRSVYLTFGDRDDARRVAGALLERRLIACANLFPAGSSLYRWQGEVVEEPEMVMICKTAADRVAELREAVAELHPYDVPCVVALSAADGLPAYLDWVVEETRPG